MSDNDNAAAGAADDEKKDGTQNQANDDNKEVEDPLANVDPKQTTPQQQRVLMKRVGYKMQQTGELWYPISKKWYNSWIEYTCFTKGVMYKFIYFCIYNI